MQKLSNSTNPQILDCTSRDSNSPLLLVAHIAYDGSSFYGSQFQKDKITINGRLQEVLKSFGLNSKILCAGRTDKGVHALENVITIPIPYRPKNLLWFKEQINLKLAPHIHINTLTLKQNFHPRFHAKSRLYRYIISSKPLNVFQARYVYFYPVCGAEQITKAVRLFEGRHNFAYFAKQIQQEDAIREIFWARFYQKKEYFIFSFRANGFLHSQIRLMISALLALGEGKITQEQLKEQLSLQARHTHTLVPPEGLYLCKIYY